MFNSTLNFLQIQIYFIQRGGIWVNPILFQFEISDFGEVLYSSQFCATEGRKTKKGECEL